MRKLALATVAATLMLGTVAAAPTTVADPPEGFAAAFELAPGDAEQYVGASGTGGTTEPAGNDPSCSTDDTTHKCDRILLKTLGSGLASFQLDAAYDPADFDVAVFEADADGNITNEEPVAESGSFWGPTPVLIFDPYEHGEWEAGRNSHYTVIVYYYLAGGGYSIDFGLA